MDETRHESRRKRRVGRTVIQITVPGHARPSVRITERSKWSKRAKAYLAWQKHVAEYCKGPSVPWEAIYAQYTFYFHNRRHGDLVNLVKSTEDGIQYGGLIKNDKAVRECHARILYCPSPEEERVEIVLSEADL